ncbi:MAG: VWA domain-containing protein, partial [Oscillospiraceae bacterium]|nr:VWA domain-containing protein [Oscillospiraceae bacterium]
MLKETKRTLALVLALIMMFGTFSGSLGTAAYADEAEPEEQVQVEYPEFRQSAFIDWEFDSEAADRAEQGEDFVNKGLHLALSAPEGVFPEGSELKVALRDYADVNLSVSKEREAGYNVRQKYCFQVGVYGADGETYISPDTKNNTVPVTVTIGIDELPDKAGYSKVSLYRTSYADKRTDVLFSGKELEGNTITAEAYGLGYWTLEFEYLLTYRLKTDEEVLLKDICDYHHLSGTPSQVISGAPGLFTVTQNEDGDYVVKALSAFGGAELELWYDGVKYSVMLDAVPGEAEAEEAEETEETEEEEVEELEEGYHITFTATEGGKVAYVPQDGEEAVLEESIDQTIAEIADLKDIEAVADEGYVFKGWMYKGEKFHEGETFTWANVPMLEDSGFVAAFVSTASAAEALEKELSEATKKVYTATTAGYIVTATLADAAAVPDNARLTVSPVTAESDANYDTYFEALNANVSEGEEYTNDNTVLLDIKFVYDVTKEDGSVETVEFEPAEGTVDVKITIRDPQLGAASEAENAPQIEVAHIALKDHVKSPFESKVFENDINEELAAKFSEFMYEFGFMAGSAGFSVDDFAVDFLKDADVNLGSLYSTVEFSLDSFSIVAVKTMTDNEDGTYTLSLEVSSSSETSSHKTKADVIIVFDRSGSMDSNTGGYGSPTRMEVAQDATNSLIDTLLAANGGNNDDDMVQIALVSFATHATRDVNLTTSGTALKNAVNGMDPEGGTNWEQGLQYAANITTRTSTEDVTINKYVIFVSDGNPTFRQSANGYTQDWSSYYQAYGTGRDSGAGSAANITRCYNAATDDARALVTAGFDFYGIGAFGNVDRMQGLVTAAGESASTNYFSASNSEALDAAFAAIANAVTGNLGYGNVGITDGVTTYTAGDFKAAVSAENVDEFVYTITDPNGTAYEITLDDSGKIKTINGSATAADITLSDDKGSSMVIGIGKAFPAASFENDAVKWDMAGFATAPTAGRLLSGFKYKVSFRVWPSQAALDLVADLNNGVITYDELTPEQQAQVVESGGKYSLKTNTTAALNYQTVNVVTDADGNVISETTGDPETLPIANPTDTISMDSAEMSVEKKWENGGNLDPIYPEVYMTAKRDGSNFDVGDGATFVLSTANDYKKTFNIAPGRMTVDAAGNIVILETGHEYMLTEEFDENQYHYDLSSEVARPMYINGVLTMLVLEDADHPAAGRQTYSLDGKTYYVKSEGTAVLTATNIRRSHLDVIKHIAVYDADGNDVTESVKDLYADTEFNYTISFPNIPSDYGDIWWYKYTPDEDGDYEIQGVKYKSEGGHTAGTTVTFTLKPDQFIRFINLPKGTNYTVTETPASGWTVVLPDSSGTASGTITQGNTLYNVTFLNAKRFEPTTASFPVKKVMSVPEGMTGPESWSYTINLTAADGVPMPETTSGTVSNTTDTVTFGEITYTQPGTYEYTVSESGSAPGVTNDPDAAGKKVTVTVVDNGDGTLTATADSTANAPLTFTNTYNVNKISAVIPVKKTVESETEGTAPGAWSYDFT